MTELAALVDSMLSSPLDSKAMEAKAKEFKRPSNCAFLQAPRMNTEVWNASSIAVRTADSSLQEVQKQFLQSVVPTLKAIEKLFEVKDAVPMETIDLKEVIKTLTDSIAFVGKANMSMVKHRKEMIKPILADKFKKLCNPSIKFSGEFLFGQDVVKDIKVISEMSKCSEDIARASSSRYSRGTYRGSRGGKAARARGSRGGRYIPYKTGNYSRARGGTKKYPRGNYRQSQGKEQTKDTQSSTDQDSKQ